MPPHNEMRKMFQRLLTTICTTDANTQQVKPLAYSRQIVALVRPFPYEGKNTSKS